MKRFRMMVLCSMIAASASARTLGNERGNGGYSVVCKDTNDTITSIELFDYWENARNPELKGALDLGTNNSIKQKIILFTERLAKYDKEFADLVGQSALEYESRIDELLTDKPLNNTYDDGGIIFPEGNCELQQFAEQPLEEPTKLEISKKQYNSPITSDDTRAGLILHEALYRHAYQMGQMNSYYSRRLNFLIATASSDEDEIFSTLSKLKGPSAEQVVIFSPTFNKRVVLLKKSFGEGHWYRGIPAMPQVFVNQAARLILRPSTDANVYLHKNGHFHVIYDVPRNKHKMEVKVQGKFLEVSELEFSEETHLPYRLKLKSISTLKLSNEIKVACNGLLLFSATDQVKHCTLFKAKAPDNQVSVRGEAVSLPGGYYVSLRTPGELGGLGMSPGFNIKFNNCSKRESFKSAAFDSQGFITKGTLDTYPKVFHNGEELVLHFNDYAVTFNGCAGTFYALGTVKKPKSPSGHRLLETKRSNLKSVCLVNGFDDIYDVSAFQEFIDDEVLFNSELNRPQRIRADVANVVASVLCKKFVTLNY